MQHARSGTRGPFIFLISIVGHYLSFNFVNYPKLIASTVGNDLSLNFVNYPKLIVSIVGYDLSLNFVSYKKLIVSIVEHYLSLNFFNFPKIIGNVRGELGDYMFVRHTLCKLIRGRTRTTGVCKNRKRLRL